MRFEEGCFSETDITKIDRCAVILFYPKENIVNNKKLLDILACPSCKGKLQFNETRQELICRFENLAYPIRDGIPVMLVNEARLINSNVGQGM